MTRTAQWGSDKLNFGGFSFTGKRSMYEQIRTCFRDSQRGSSGKPQKILSTSGRPNARQGNIAEMISFL